MIHENEFTTIDIPSDSTDISIEYGVLIGRRTNAILMGCIISARTGRYPNWMKNCDDCELENGVSCLLIEAAKQET